MTDDERIIEFRLSEVDELCAYEVKYDTEGLKHLILIAIGEDADRLRYEREMKE